MEHNDQRAHFLPPLPAGYRVRECRREDLPSVCEVEGAAFAGQPLYPEFFFVQSMDIFANGFLVAEHDEKVVGYIIAVLGQGRKRQGWILSLGVHPNHQRRGVGSNLSARAEEFIASEGQQMAILTVDPNNATALSLYHHRGYKQIDKLDNHFGRGDNRLLMALPLAESPSEESDLE